MFDKEIKINFYDCDPAGILFYGNLFKYAHKVYEEFVQSFNMEYSYFENDKFIVPIIHTEGNYSIPMKPGDIVKVSLHVSQIRSSSFELTYKFINAESNICSDVKTVHVFVEKDTFEKTSIPKDILKNLEANKG